MLWLLRMLQRLSRIRRRIFGSALPHWLKDGLPLVAYVNIIDLLPTLLAITLAPWHFYARLPQYLVNKRTWFKTPLKFFTSAITLIVALIFLLAPDVMTEAGISDKTVIAGYLAIICLSAPFTVPLVCLVIRILLGIASAAPGGQTSPRSIRANLLIPLSPWTYIRLDWISYFWSLFYYGIYFYIGLQFLQLIGLYQLEFIGFIHRKSDKCLSFITNIDPNHVLSETDHYLERCRSLDKMIHPSSMQPEQIAFLAMSGLFAIIGYFILVHPYIWLLRASVKIPTKLMHRHDCYEIAEAITQFTSAAAARRQRSNRIARTITNLERSVTAFERNIANQNRKARDRGSNYLKTLQQERGKVFSKVIRTDSLRSFAHL
jgi:hypothetical protein